MEIRSRMNGDWKSPETRHIQTLDNQKRKELNGKKLKTGEFNHNASTKQNF